MTRTQQIEESTSKRAELMQTLRTHGALEEWTQMQNNHQGLVAQLNDVIRKLETIKNWNKEKAL